MDADVVLVELRKAGLVVHLVAPATRGPGLMVVLEGDQGEYAADRVLDVALALPGVSRAVFAEATRAILYVS